MAEAFPKLIVLTGSEEGREWTLPAQGEVRIGRSDDNQFTLEDSSVSRQHVAIIAREGRFFVRDEGSRNGTIVNGRKLAAFEEVALEHLDELKLGIYEIRFAQKSFSDTEIRAKRQQHKPAEKNPAPLDRSITKGNVPVLEKSSPKIQMPPVVEAQPVDMPKIEPEPALPMTLPRSAKKPASWRNPILLAILVFVLFGVGFYFWQTRQALKHAKATLSSENTAVDEKDEVAEEETFASEKDTVNAETETAPKAQTEKFGRTTQTVSAPEATVVPVAVSPSPSENQKFPIFLDVTTQPFPATIYFEGKRLGVTPLKVSVEVQSDQTYPLIADFELRDLHDVYRNKVYFKAAPGSDVIEIKIPAELGSLKINRLAPHVEFYLEGYYDYDKLKANPVKITDISYGKPIYLPYGKYHVELREQQSVAGSQNLITQIRYQRDFEINANNKAIDLAVTEKDLKFFPAVIRSDPSNADVYQNDAKIGTTPFQGNLPIGTNHIKIVKDGFFDKSIDIDMSMNSLYETTVTLETSKVGELLNKAKEQRSKEDLAGSMVTLIDALKYGGSGREKAEVYFLLGEGYYLQGQFAQAKPYFEKAKEHPDFKARATLGFARAAFALKENEVALSSVVEVLVNLDDKSPVALRSEANNVFRKIIGVNSVIYVYSEPAGANVYLNDKKLSQQTPLILSDLSIGSYRIEIEKPGYETFKTRQTVKMSEFATVKVKLKKDQF